MKSEILVKLGKTRSDFHRQLTALPNAIGSAVGYKRSNSKRTRTPAIIVYVREKFALETLESTSRVPTYIMHDGKRIATDVCEVGRLEYQFGPPPWFCRDRIDNQGTVTTLCRSSTGEIFGLTCAHCIEGDDHDPSTPSKITLWDQFRRDYLSVGLSGPYVNTSGLGLPGNFGFTDWGLFSIEDQGLQSIGQKATPIKMCSGNLNEVTALTAHGVIKGIVEHTQAQLPNVFADVAIRIEVGATFGGDSGALWRDNNGAAVAIHAIGEDGPCGSSMSFAMFAPRIASDLMFAGFELLAL